ncbi:MAG: hypothetical protein DI531_04135 [Brevundimonas sp.]|uniref:hypothetical protein n=1 Tax=Brevundimonas sp. TaxID=1871086 RepID=UPI000DB1F75E|nr:hypothetical protein [Brevundimonas sp.]PZU75812.1 MAG: hypothetical protein DI531_04135 [Brevundimonas sp.]
MRVGDQAVFRGYTKRFDDVPDVFWRGDVLVVADVDDEGIYRCEAVASDGSAIAGRSDMVFAEEIIPLNFTARPPILPEGPWEPTPKGSMSDINRILSQPQSQDFADLRDRAAFLFITGSDPSHIRAFFKQALSLISKMHSQPTAFDGGRGFLRLNDDVVARLDLNGHPMVQQVRRYTRDGWRIKQVSGPNARKPHTKVMLWKGQQFITVQIDGSVLDYWA